MSNSNTESLCKTKPGDLPEPGSKRIIARQIHAAMNSIGLRDITVVGHDVGGQVAYAYLREYAREINGAVIMTS